MLLSLMSLMTVTGMYGEAMENDLCEGTTATTNTMMMIMFDELL